MFSDPNTFNVGDLIHPNWNTRYVGLIVRIVHNRCWIKWLNINKGETYEYSSWNLVNYDKF